LGELSVGGCVEAGPGAGAGGEPDLPGDNKFLDQGESKNQDN
jgi:hypothetical protein